MFKICLRLDMRYTPPPPPPLHIVVAPGHRPVSRRRQVYSYCTLLGCLPVACCPTYCTGDSSLLFHHPSFLSPSSSSSLSPTPLCVLSFPFLSSYMWTPFIFAATQIVNFLGAFVYDRFFTFMQCFFKIIHMTSPCLFS
jgi:hypothetical protein